MASKYPLRADSEHLVLDPGVRRVAVTTASTVELGDVASLRRDFALAHTFLDFYLASDVEGGNTIPSALDALWVSAVTMYGRAFSNGQRHAARAHTSHLTAAEEADHRYFLDLRNKYIAHPANGFEKTVVFADLGDRQTSPAGIQRIGESHTSLSRLARIPAEKLNRLCERQIVLLTSRIDELHQAVAGELVAMGVDHVYALPDFEPPYLDGSNPRSART